MSEQAGDKPEDGQANGTSEDEEVIFPEEEAEDERTDLEKAHAERDRMREQLLRIAADFDNFRKRSRKEIEEVKSKKFAGAPWKTPSGRFCRSSTTWSGRRVR